MADMKCRYCGQRFVGGGQCNISGSPTGKHVAIPDGTNCIYCGQRFVNGGQCIIGGSPTKKHMLA